MSADGQRPRVRVRLRRGRPDAQWLPAALGALAAARAAAALLAPRSGLIAPAAVSAEAHFSPGELARARSFRRGQLAIHGAGVAVQAAVMGALVRRPPSRLARRDPHVLATAGLAGAVLSVGLTAATLPLAAASRRRGLRAGLVIQSWRGWGADVAKASALGAAMTGAGSAGLLALVGRRPRSWWLPGSVLAVAVGAGLQLVGPVLLDPVFGRFTPLAPGDARDDVLELAGRAGVQVGEVYELDASRRTTAANAYVTGLLGTRRVVLFDTLLQRFTREEVRLVVAHELAHVRHRDVPRGLLFVALVAPAGLLACARLTLRLAPPEAWEPSPDARLLPALTLSLAIVSSGVTAVSNSLSRRIEARADAFALRLTGAPEPFVSFERRIALTNLADPDPPRWITALLGTHPSTVQRIGIAVAFQAQPPPASAAPSRDPLSPGRATL